MRIKNLLIIFVIMAFIFGCSSPSGDGPSPTAIPGDTTVPTVTITYPKQGDVNDAFTVTITFSEVVIGFIISDITVGNGTVDDLTTGDDTVFLADIIPTS